MEEFEKELTIFCKRYNKRPPDFIRRVIATLLKFPELMELPECKKLYEEGTEYLDWYDNRGPLHYTEAKELEIQLITFMNKYAPDFAYALPVLIEYLISRIRYWK